MVDISVIIPTYNEEKNIEKLLNAVKVQMESGDELIVVDSYSKDRTVELAKKYTDKIFLMPREGIGPAKNLGAEKASNDVVAFLDADGPPQKDWMDIIRKRFEDDEVNGIAGLGVYISDSRLNEFLYNIYAKLVFFMGKLFYRISDVPWLPVNNCALRKRILFQYGGYKNVVCEDLDFGMRAKGLRGIVYSKGLLVTLSDRRFRDEGFLNTVLLWMKSDLKLFGGKAIDSKKYRATR